MVQMTTICNANNVDEVVLTCAVEIMESLFPFCRRENYDLPELLSTTIIRILDIQSRHKDFTGKNHLAQRGYKLT